MGDDIFLVEDLGNNRIRLVPTPTHVSEAGTPVNKALLQHMENHLVPPGAIIMWSGSINDIPVGWALCDGSNGTPDLRDRFIVGAGGSYNVGNTGGANTVTLSINQMPSHNHTGEIAMAGEHRHDVWYTREGVSGGADMLVVADLEFTSFAGSVRESTDRSGNHTHSFTINSTGGGQAHENRPPYYALCFIMKL